MCKSKRRKRLLKHLRDTIAAIFKKFLWSTQLFFLMSKICILISLLGRLYVSYPSLNEPYFLLKALLDMVIDLRKNFKFCNIYTENFLQVLLHALALCLHPHNWTELMKNTEAHWLYFTLWLLNEGPPHCCS